MKAASLRRSKRKYALAAGHGVIATVMRTINRQRGATIEEIVGRLATKFPERKVSSMRATARINASIFAGRRKRQSDGRMRYWLN